MDIRTANARGLSRVEALIPSGGVISATFVESCLVPPHSSGPSLNVGRKPRLLATVRPYDAAVRAHVPPVDGHLRPVCQPGTPRCRASTQSRGPIAMHNVSTIARVRGHSP